MPSVSLKLLRFRDNHHDISIFIIVDIAIIIVDIIKNGNNKNKNNIIYGKSVMLAEIECRPQIC